jgi:hypothetical protein
MYQMAVIMAIEYTYQAFPFQGPPQFTKIGIFWFENIPSGNPGVHVTEKPITN